MNKDLGTVVKEAEKAVSHMPEGQMKLKAFEIVLDNLLKGEKKSKKIPRTKVVKKAKPKQDIKKEREIDLDVDKLESLKNIFSDMKDVNGYTLVLRIAYFLKEELGKEKFLDSDIEHCYSRLLALKVGKMPILNTIPQICRNMTSKSKKKFWLKRTEDNFYSIAPAGFIEIRERGW